MYIDSFGKVLQTERKSWGMSRRKLAKIIGEDEELIENIESGNEKNPDFYLILKICGILDISIFSILTPNGFEEFFKAK